MVYLNGLQTNDNIRGKSQQYFNTFGNRHDVFQINCPFLEKPRRVWFRVKCVYECQYHLIILVLYNISEQWHTNANDYVSEIDGFFNEQKDAKQQSI